MITRYHDAGGIVQQTTTNTGTIVMDAVRGGITGVVVDSAGRPVVGSPVRIQGTEAADTTATDGTFSFADVGEGIWSVASAVPELDGLGYVTELEVEVYQSGMSPVCVKLPSLADVIRERCERPSASDMDHVSGPRWSSESAIPLRRLEHGRGR